MHSNPNSQLAAVQGVLDSNVEVKEIINSLTQMYISAVTSADGNETDNFTAKSLSPSYQVMMEFLTSLLASKT